MAASRQRRLEIGTDKAMGHRRQVGNIDVGSQRHAPAMDLEDLAATVAIRDRDRDLTIEPARPAECGVKGIG